MGLHHTNVSAQYTKPKSAGTAYQMVEIYLHFIIWQGSDKTIVGTAKKKKTLRKPSKKPHFKNDQYSRIGFN